MNIYRATASAGDVTDALQRAAAAGQEHAAAVSATAGRESSGHVPVHDVDSVVFDHRGADAEEFGAIGHDRRDDAGQKRGQRIGLDSRRFRRVRSTGAAAARHRQMKKEEHFEFFNLSFHFFSLTFAFFLFLLCPTSSRNGWPCDEETWYFQKQKWN